jgi:DeoR/GlpR family transcriptional regulator of sugar metabolism
MGLLAENRRQRILDKLRHDGRISVTKTAGQLNVTEVTIRRDLAFLQKKGLLKKTYGGAVLAGPAEIADSVGFRHTKKVSAKRNIGQLAAQLIDNGDVIYLEAGSTCYEIIPHLSTLKELTIIVNSLPLMNRLHELTRHRIIVTGGEYRPDRMDMIGPTAETAIAQLSGFKAFTGADDISLYAGISGADVATVGFAKLVLRQASMVVFVGDDTKFDNPALYKIADLATLDYIVTNKPPSEQWHKAAAEKNIRLMYP